MKRLVGHSIKNNSTILISVGLIAIVLIKTLNQYFSIDWGTVAAAGVSLLLPIFWELMKDFKNDQQKKQDEIDEIKERLNEIPNLKAETEKANLLKVSIKNLEQELDAVVAANRSQEVAIAYLEAVTESIYRHEQTALDIEEIKGEIGLLKNKRGTPVQQGRSARLQGERRLAKPPTQGRSPKHQRRSTRKT